ncbi:N-acetyltransferase [Bordetella genomosp. 12]|uniref:N-acetyltransferase n=1 Tax=Bordetella genomosp. 12 TaxID=463035 RepID=UPI0026A96294
MRIDVSWDMSRVESELDVLQGRLRQAGRLDPAQAVPALLPAPLRVWRQEADGEFFLYIEDARSGVLAGCIVFNRLIEVNRRLDRVLRSPHARLRAAYQRRGVAASLYQRELQAGYCLLSGARQSSGAHALWESLAARHDSGYVRVAQKRLYALPESPDQACLDDLCTRRLLCGGGWTLAALLRLTPRRGQAVTGEPTRPGLPPQEAGLSRASPSQVLQSTDVAAPQLSNS